MGKLIASLILIAAMLPLAWQQGRTSPEEEFLWLQPQQTATSLSELSGLWYQFPGGLSLEFDEDGTVEFGVTADGRAIGHRAFGWFEGEYLFIRFVQYDGAQDGCNDGVGRYRVALAPNGSISFEPIGDECRFRLELLDGGPNGSARDFRPFD